MKKSSLKIIKESEGHSIKLNIMATSEMSFVKGGGETNFDTSSEDEDKDDTKNENDNESDGSGHVPIFIVF